MTGPDSGGEARPMCECPSRGEVPHSIDCPASTVPDNAGLREALAVELDRHRGLRGPMDDERPDVWQNRCECGWDDGDERPGWRERYRLHIADALLSDHLAALLAERDRYREQVAAVRELADEIDLDAEAREDRANKTPRTHALAFDRARLKAAARQQRIAARRIRRALGDPT